MNEESILPALSPADPVRRSPQPLASEVGAEIVLMSLERGNCYGLGEIGSRVWRELEEPLCARELAARLAPDYDAPAEVVERDLLGLFDQLLAEGLIERG